MGKTDHNAHSVYQLGVNPPADIASGRIAEVRRRSMSCNCMTRTSQQECRGILENRELSGKIYCGSSHFFIEQQTWNMYNDYCSQEFINCCSQADLCE